MSEKLKTIDIMRKFIATVVTLALASGLAFAQDLAGATELYNNGAAALASGDKEGALENFIQALEAAQTLGADGEAIVANCKNAIPKVNLSLIKDMIKGSNFDEAIAKCKEAAAQALDFGEVEISDEITKLVGTALQMKGNGLITTKNFAGAVEVFKELLATDETNGMAALRLGQALAALGQNDEAVEAYEKAAANGQQANAIKQLSNIFVKKAAAALKTKDYASAFEAAVKSIEYAPSANAYKVAGTAAMNIDKKAEAVTYLKKYLEVSPTAADAAQIKAAIEALQK